MLRTGRRSSSASGARSNSGESECWPWLGAVSSAGYGQFKPRGDFNPVVSAHVIAFELMTGEQVQAGVDIHHVCTNRRCCNPRHMQLLGHGVHGRLSARSRWRKE